MATYEPWEAKLAWQIALQARGCPPDPILYGETGGELSAHLAQCPFCWEMRSSGTGSLDETGLAREIARHAPAHPLRAPRPGAVCTISRRLAGWGPKGRYYNPPLVLLLELLPDVPGGARVVPLYDDPRLAGPGDIFLESGLFAESWNAFAVAVDDLECCRGSVEEERLQEVLSAVGADWGDPPAGTPLEAFRRLEVELAAFLALQALSGLMDHREFGPIEELEALFPDGASLKAALADDYPNVAWPEAPMDAPALLAHARFREAGAAMAAAGDVHMVGANLVVIRGGNLALQHTLCEIRHFSASEEGLVLGGRVLSPLVERVELFAQWVREGTPPRDCDRSSIDAAGGFFRIMFRNMTEDRFKSGRLVLLVAGSAQP